MKPLLGIFLDGLKPESLRHMPFLSSLGHSTRLKSEYGYSITCHASMYSGVRPDRHKTWFVWKKSPATSPFRNFDSLMQLPFMSSLLGKYFLHKTASLFEKEPNTSFFGIPRFVHVPLKTVKFLDVVEKRMAHEDHYLEEVPSFFDLIKRANRSTYVVGLDKSEKEESNILRKFTDHRAADFIYWFIGDVDHFSHQYGQESEIAAVKLRELDDLLSEKYDDLVFNIGPVDVIAWSDHGHIDVHTKIDLYEVADKVGVDLNQLHHVIDATCVRFWVEKDEDADQINLVLDNLGDVGETIDADIEAEHRLHMGDDRYGDIIYFVNPGYMFNKTIWGWSRSMASMHGYNPNFPISDGVLISNNPIAEGERHLVDIAPTIIERLEISCDINFDGKNFLNQVV